MNEYHKPVLLGEVLVHLGVDNAHLNTNTRIIDATLGAGGYSLAFVARGADVLGIETDPAMLKIARSRLETARPPSVNHGGSPTLVQGNFVDMASIARLAGYEQVDGIVFDLGVATEQLTSPYRGFSFRNENALLDMRLSPETQGVTASDLINALDKTALTKLFGTTCTWAESTKLASRIVSQRETRQVATVGDFLILTKGIFKARRGINPVTRAFLALRMAVNSELENLSEALVSAVNLLGGGGKLAVVSFHSGEDAIVKRKFQEFEANGIGRVVTKRPIVPGKNETEGNPRARSAKLRVFIKNESNKKK